MILKVVFTILFFLAGILDKDLSLAILGSSVYLGMIVYLIIFILGKNRNIITIYGFSYYLGLGAGMPLIGLLPLIMLIVELLYTLMHKVITTHSKILNFIITGIYFALNYLVVSYIINQTNIISSISTLILVLLFVLLGGIVSLFSSNYER